MAKKYLLYIHDDELFDKELYKSELVNRLLKGHWAHIAPGDYIAPIEDIEKASSPKPTKSERSPNESSTRKAAVKSQTPKPNPTCPDHGIPLDTKGHCTWRGCKHGSK